MNRVAYRDTRRFGNRPGEAGGIALSCPRAQEAGMPRAIVTGSGTEIAANKVTNEMLSKLMDTSDEWIKERSGIETRYFVGPGTGTSDLALPAARRALEAARVEPKDVDMVVFATMTPDHYFPGAGPLLQAKLGLPPVGCFDIRQQCTGFIYGLQLADAQIRAGNAKTVLLVGAEVHSGFMPWTEEQFEYVYGRSSTPPTAQEREWNNRFRNLTVLFGDAAAAVVLQATDDPNRGVVDSILHMDGSEYDKLYVPGTGFKRRPYTSPEQIAAGEHIPVMDGRQVFRMATTRMSDVAQTLLARHGVKPADVSLVLMHQANQRISEFVQKMLGLRDDQVFHNIHKYGNTTAATIPLLWDECARAGRIKPGDLILMVAFGAGMSWGASLLRA
jgi:3-oxoacyl-[acyl-carrier-protein] synthase III